MVIGEIGVKPNRNTANKIFVFSACFIVSQCFSFYLFFVSFRLVCVDLSAMYRDARARSPRLLSINRGAPVRTAKKYYKIHSNIRTGVRVYRPCVRPSISTYIVHRSHVCSTGPWLLLHRVNFSIGFTFIFIVLVRLCGVVCALHTTTVHFYYRKPSIHIFILQ